MLSPLLLSRLRLRSTLVGPVELGGGIEVSAVDPGGAIVYWVEAGSLFVAEPQRPFARLGPGDMLFVPWGAPHLVAASTETRSRFPVDDILRHRDAEMFSTLRIAGTGAVARFVSTLSYWDEAAEPLARMLLPPVTILPALARTPRMAATLAAMRAAMTTPGGDASVLVNHLAGAVIALCIAAIDPARIAVADPMVARAVALIHAEEERTTLGDLAARLNMGRTSFCCRFKAATGQTPAAYIQQVRLARAAVALGEGASIGAAAEVAGFASAPSFQRAFTARYGVSAGRFRAQRAMRG